MKTSPSCSGGSCFAAGAAACSGDLRPFESDPAAAVPEPVPGALWKRSPARAVTSTHESIAVPLWLKAYPNPQVDSSPPRDARRPSGNRAGPMLDTAGTREAYLLALPVLGYQSFKGEVQASRLLRIDVERTRISRALGSGEGEVPWSGRLRAPCRSPFWRLPAGH